MNRIRLFFATALAMGLLGLGLVTSPALAITYYSPITSFEDTDLDWLVKGATPLGTVTAPGTGATINQGDRLVGVVEFPNTTGVLAGQGPTSVLPGELVAVFDITVVSKTATATPGLFNFVFGPTAGSGYVDSAVVGTMVTFYLDPTPDTEITNGTCGTLAQCVALVTGDDGAKYLNVGFNGDPNNLWLAVNAADSIDAVAASDPNAVLGGFNYFLNILTNNTGINFGPRPCTANAIACPAGGDGSVQMIGSGDILGGQFLTNGAFGRSDADAGVAPIPEPASLLLLGAGLLGVNFISRRRVKR